MLQAVDGGEKSGLVESCLRQWVEVAVALMVDGGGSEGSGGDVGGGGLGGGGGDGDGGWQLTLNLNTLNPKPKRLLLTPIPRISTTPEATQYEGVRKTQGCLADGSYEHTHPLARPSPQPP